MLHVDPCTRPACAAQHHRHRYFCRKPTTSTPDSPRNDTIILTTGASTRALPPSVTKTAASSRRDSLQRGCRPPASFLPGKHVSSRLEKTGAKPRHHVRRSNWRFLCNSGRCDTLFLIKQSSTKPINFLGIFRHICRGVLWRARHCHPPETRYGFVDSVCTRCIAFSPATPTHILSDSTVGVAWEAQAMAIGPAATPEPPITVTGPHTRYLAQQPFCCQETATGGRSEAIVRPVFAYIQWCHQARARGTGIVSCTSGLVPCKD